MPSTASEMSEDGGALAILVRLANFSSPGCRRVLFKHTLAKLTIATAPFTLIFANPVVIALGV
jgi:hypothetical protein